MDIVKLPEARQQTAEDAKPVASRTLLNTPSLRILFIRMKAGGELKEHQVKANISVQVLAGHITFKAGEKSAELRTGELVWLPPEERHALTAHEDSEVLVTFAAQE